MNTFNWKDAPNFGHQMANAFLNALQYVADDRATYGMWMARAAKIERQFEDWLNERYKPELVP